MTTANLDLKIRRMHEALGRLEEADIGKVEPKLRETKDWLYFKLDFGKDQTEAELTNTAHLLIANIASVKDHLKLWCSEFEHEFKGDILINENRSVAIVHDLWNIDKHGSLSMPPRSGYTPKIQDLRQSMTLATGGSSGSSARVQIDPRTGEMKVETTGGAKVNLTITGDVISEAGDALGDFATICTNAAGAWEKTLVEVGVFGP